MSGINKTIKIGFIGAGNMATAIAESIVRKDLVKYNQIYAGDPNENARSKWKSLGANITQNGLVVEEADIIFLAVKPPILPVAIADIQKTIQHPKKVHKKLFVSILPGVTIESLEKILAVFEGSRVIRTMPNTPMMVGVGCTGYCPGHTATKDDINVVHTLLSSSGICQLIPESVINAVVGVSGSGPAYVYIIIEALSDGGVKMGMTRQMATQFAAQTVMGAAKMVLETGKHPGTLKDEVCSPGGTTIAAVHALEKAGLRAALIDAVDVATNRANELGKKH